MKNRILYVLSITLMLLIFITCSKDEPIIEYTLTTNVFPSGGGSITPSSGTFESGDIITLTSNPSEH